MYHTNVRCKMQQKVGVGYMRTIFLNFCKVKPFEKQKLFFNIYIQHKNRWNISLTWSTNNVLRDETAD